LGYYIQPVIKEYGISTIDTRHLSRFERIEPQNIIVTRHFSTILKDKTIRECAFAETNKINQNELPSVIRESLQIQNSNTGFRNIIIFGHSVKPDLRILQRLGIDIFTIAPTVVILDTHNMAREVLGSNSIRLNGHAPIIRFTLAAVLAELQVPFDETKLHNGGNGATYTLFLLLKLAIRSGEARTLGKTESINLENLIRLMLWLHPIVEGKT
jgi:hypothetical protein